MDIGWEVYQLAEALLAPASGFSCLLETAYGEDDAAFLSIRSAYSRDIFPLGVVTNMVSVPSLSSSGSLPLILKVNSAGPDLVVESMV